MRPIAIYYEHSGWMKPLFKALERRGVPYAALEAGRHCFDPGEARKGFSLLFNRMSPSAHLRGRGNAIPYTLAYLRHVERRGLRVINGSKAFSFETSKAAQLGLLQELGLPYPRSRVINSADQATEAASGLQFPVIVKANLGGSGASITRYDSPKALQVATVDEALDLGPDGTALVQEYLPARDDRITRVEILNGELLYAISVPVAAEGFNLCPADLCHPDSGEEPTVEAYRPSSEVISAVLRITAAAGIEVGGVEYLVDDRNGRIVYYDINSLSNFVADAPQVIGFDPFENLVDFLLREVDRLSG